MEDDQKALIKKWKGNKRYTLKLVDAMPETDFDFKPTSDIKSFQSQVSHITTWLRTHSRYVTGYEFDKLKARSKQELLHALEEFFDSFIQQLSAIENTTLNEVIDLWYGKTSKRQVTQVMDNHLSHHRGQLVIYLRLKHITPPSYIGW